MCSRCTYVNQLTIIVSIFEMNSDSKFIDNHVIISSSIIYGKQYRRRERESDERDRYMLMSLAFILSWMDVYLR